MKFIRQSPFKLLHFAVFAGGILGFALLGIYPNYTKQSDMDLEIGKLNQQIEEQKVLFPLFVELMKKVQLKDPEGILTHKDSRLKPEEFDSLPGILGEIALQTSLTIHETAPDLESMIAGSKFYKMDIRIEGALLAFQEFLAELSRRPYFHSIENFQIRAVLGSENLEMQIRIRILKA